MVADFRAFSNESSFNDYAIGFDGVLPFVLRDGIDVFLTFSGIFGIMFQHVNRDEFAHGGTFHPHFLPAASFGMA